MNTAFQGPTVDLRQSPEEKKSTGYAVIAFLIANAAIVGVLTYSNWYYSVPTIPDFTRMVEIDVRIMRLFYQESCTTGNQQQLELNSYGQLRFLPLPAPVKPKQMNGDPNLI